MAFWEYLWPFGQKYRERCAENKAVEERFERELDVLKRRGVTLKTVVAQLKGEPVSTHMRAQLPSYPTPQESGGPT
jgi:hypothetical protein